MWNKGRPLRDLKRFSSPYLYYKPSSLKSHTKSAMKVFNFATIVAAAGIGELNDP